MEGIFNIKDDFRRRRKKSKFEKRSYAFYYNKFKRLYCAVYDWTLPNEINTDTDVIENYLFEDGLCLVWKHDTLGWICTRCSVTGRNVNGKPNRFRPFFDTNVEDYRLPDKDLTLDKCIPIFDTSIFGVKRSDAMFLIEEIVDIGETIRQQTFNQKTPLMAVSGTPQQRQKNLIDVKNIADGYQILEVDEDISGNLKVLDFKAPFNVQLLNALRNVRINEILESGGIDGADPFMKQDSARLLVSQVESNDEILNYILTDGLNARMRACDRISELIGPCSVGVAPFVRPLMAQQQAGNEDEEQLQETGENGRPDNKTVQN